MPTNPSRMKTATTTEMTKSQVLAALNRKDEAATAEKKALELAGPLQLHQYARQLLGRKAQ